jgi:hypothetical protein
MQGPRKSRLPASVTTALSANRMSHDRSSSGLARCRNKRPDRKSLAKQSALALLVMAGVSALPVPANGQSPLDSPASASPAVFSTVIASPLSDSTYKRPTGKTKLSNYFYEAFGPYPVVVVGVAAGINQFDNSPPEWKQGAEGYGKRFASDFGIAAVATTTRYAFAAALHEDTLYYRCGCRGVFPRLRHAMISTLTARRGDDGHRVFSFASLVAPYAGSMTAVYGWYPGRYGPKDGFRLGNYSLLGYVGANIALEFVYSGPHSLLSRMHLNNPHGAPSAGSGP